MGKHVKKACFKNLLEGCVSAILSLTSPRDACRSCLVSSLFKSAAESDGVWEKFLPSGYREIISRSSSYSGINFPSSKKQLYFRLVNDPLLIDGDHKSFALEKLSGKKCFMIGARDIHIVWGQTPKYWRYTDFPGSRFSEVAELLAVCWFEFFGSLETRLLSLKTVYSVYLVLKFAEGAYGFDHPPTEAVIKVVGGGGGSNSGSIGARPIYLLDRRQQELQDAPPSGTGLIRRRLGHMLGPVPSRREGYFPKERNDGWMEIEMGQFYNDGGEEEDSGQGGEVQFSLTEIKSGLWKAGVIIQGVEIRPKAD
ncbi:hypothetical protein MKW94_019946 [Papaver nudicaule]|uniref:Uncharacterized protein n=1 Tax=Papaver nudicaule TaxID=74823 RepID=A0AA42B1B1_PAPNU|nr:hypothetical protein [Papaver nudicaule]